jgi:hypothetical protein
MMVDLVLAHRATLTNRGKRRLKWPALPLYSSTVLPIVCALRGFLPALNFKLMYSGTTLLATQILTPIDQEPDHTNFAANCHSLEWTCRYE